MLRLYIGLYNPLVNLIPIRTFRINLIRLIRLIWNAKQFNSIRASSEDLKDLLTPLAVTVAHIFAEYFGWSTPVIGLTYGAVLTIGGCLGEIGS
jgi:hypothetical protein